MASLIKNQILKHLSKFAKNLTVDQISVEVLRGTGSLQNIELNEVVLTEVLELPAWLRVQKATCNQIAVKIPWTSLKTLPVKVYIDEIRVEMVMSSDLRQNRSNTDSPSTPYSSEHSASAAYNFANRVVEGMSLYINTVEVFFTSEKFGGSFMLSRLCLESRTPTWKEAGDLHQTRIKDARLSQVLIFKQVSWQLLRVEASNYSTASTEVNANRQTQTPPGQYNINAPLRLITNQGRCRVSMKKSTIDGSVIAGRLQLILGDILWVATLPQVRSAVNFYLYLMEMIQKAAELNKVQKAEKLLQQADLAHVAAKAATAGSKLVPPQQVRGGVGNVSAAFQQYDVVETSYHFYGARIDLHICDEPSDESAFAKSSSANDGALQLTMHKLSVDFYPYHLAAGDRSSWIYYRDRACRDWIVSLLDSYYKLFSSKLGSKTREHFRSEWPKLMSQCCVVRLDDIVVHCLTKAGDKGAPEKLLSCDREVLKLPDDMPVLHAEFSDYYYASERCQYLPVPPSNTHVQWNPVRVFLDYKTLRWISFMYLDIVNALGLKSSSFESVPHHDVHVQALMPRLIVPSDGGVSVKSSNRKSLSDPKPNCLVVQAANVVLDNTLMGSNNRTRDALKRYVSQLEDYSLYANDTEAFLSAAALPTRTPAFRHYLTTLCEIEQSQLPLSSNSQTKRSPDNERGGDGGIDSKSDGSAATDVWTVSLSPLWIDFNGSNSVRYPRPMPFVTDVPITIWLVPNFADDQTTATVLLKLDGPLKLLMDGDQYSFLYQAIFDLGRLTQTLVEDAKNFDTSTSTSDLVPGQLSFRFCCLGPIIELSFLLPSAIGGGAEEMGGSSGDRAMSRSSSDVSGSVLGTNAAFPTSDSGQFDNFQKRSQAGPINNVLNSTVQDGFIGADSFPSDIDAASIDIAMGSMIAEDSISVITDVSDVDDDHFVQVDSPDLSPFDEIFPQRKQSVQLRGGPRRVMEAMDAFQEETERLVDHNKTTALIDLTTRVLQRKVSILTLRLRQCQMAFAYAGDESRLTLLIPSVAADEQNDITLEEAHKFFNTKASANEEQSLATVGSSSTGSFPIEIRSGFRDASDPGYLEMDIRNLQLALRNENLLHLTTFLQGGETSTPIDSTNGEPKMRVRVVDATILLTYPNSIEPIRLKLDSVWMLRTKDEETELKAMKEESDRRKIAELERENAELHQKLNEAKALVQRLAKDNYNVAL